MSFHVANLYRRSMGMQYDIRIFLDKEGILHISLAFLNPGDGVLVPNPGYPTYSSVSKLVEARLIPYELIEEL